ncbi:hypothetical protein M501DRAFT_1013924 [Patellaria atrata CBS 101060]|uniref:BTB domain-containing protein n=1 Tax=Patellaria atrata CBS 101060 TaxID=1346257 RepID=A0A9P4VUZ5_9PEZI|nr:hypothetical protein M501DRAFT_1013924 [Patellaria atrata CBS 101060]
MAESTVILLSSIASLFTSGNYSDFTVICGSETYKVHKAVICPQSEFFQKTFEGNFKESESNSVDLSAQHPRIVQAMLMFFYTGGYSQTKGEESEELHPMMFHVLVYAIAGMYTVPHLKELAKKWAAEAFRRSWSEAEFTNVIEKIYDDNVLPRDNELKKEVLWVTRNNRKTLLQNDRFVEMMREIGDFGTDLFILGPPPPPNPVEKRLRCPLCRAAQPTNSDGHYSTYNPTCRACAKQVGHWNWS